MVGNRGGCNVLPAHMAFLKAGATRTCIGAKTSAHGGFAAVQAAMTDRQGAIGIILN